MKKWDFVVILLLLLLSFTPYILKPSYGDNMDGIYAEISMDGEIVDKISLNDLSYTDTLEFKSKFGQNKIIIEHGTIQVIESNCSDHVCEHGLPGAHPGDVIVCLPNRFLIEIKGNITRDDVDIVPY